MAKHDGGPAFPAVIPMVHVEEQGKDYPNYAEAGMSLRDNIAIAAMQAKIIANAIYQVPPMNVNNSVSGIAHDAYAHADAMLVERGKHG